MVLIVCLYDALALNAVVFGLMQIHGCVMVCSFAV